MKHSRSGFSLIELVVTILAASIVTLGTVSMMLFGLKITGRTHSLSAEQQAVHIFFSHLENLANNGSIKHIKSSSEFTDNWALYSNTETLVEYKDKTLYIHSNYVLFDDLAKSSASTNETGTLLNVSITTKSGKTYQTSVYFRTQTISPFEAQIPPV